VKYLFIYECIVLNHAEVKERDPLCRKRAVEAKTPRAVCCERLVFYACDLSSMLVFLVCAMCVSVYLVVCGCEDVHHS